MGGPSIPTLQIEDPSGRRVTVAPASAGDRLGELADALGLDRARPLHVDGRPAGRHDSLAGAGLRRGSRLAVGDAPPPTTASDPVVIAVCESGPAAGAATPLTPGRCVVGRAATAGVVVADDALEPHHALVEVAPDGSVEVVQVAGRVPCRIDGQPLAGRSAVPDGGVVELGASRLRLARAGPAPVTGATLAAAPGDPWLRTLRRTPRVVPRWDPDPIPMPVAGVRRLRPGAAGILAALFTTAGTVAAAVLMRSPMFLVFGAAALLAATGMWAIGTVGAARDGRRLRAARDRDIAAFATALERQREARWRHHLATTPGLPEAVAAATALRSDVWSRRPGHGDAYHVAIGWGVVEWSVAVERGPGGDPLPPELGSLVAAAGRFDDAPVVLDLGAGAALAVTGSGAAAVARAVLVQLATWVGPADLRVVAVVDDPDAWDWCRWLPHVAGPDGPAVVAADQAESVAAALADVDAASGRHVVVVTDRAELLAHRTGALRRFLGAARSAAVVAVVEPGGSPPALCRSVLELGSLGVGRFRVDASVDAHPASVHAAGMTMAAASTVARHLAGLDDPEDATGGSAALPDDVGIGDLLELHAGIPIDDPIAIAAAWRGCGPDPPPVAVLGAASDGVVEVDLARDGPHALVAGTTGSGKSELLRTLVASLAARCGPDHVTFVLVDYKGGSTFDACADLPHTVGLVTDLDERLAERALVSLEAELRRREHLLRGAGVVDLAAWRARPGAAALPRLVVVIDEFAALATELPGFLDALVGIAQRGRSLGVHLVLATQRPAGVVSDDIRANTNLRLALRLNDTADARDIVGDDAPTAFPRRTPGRSMVRLGPGDHVVFQAAHSSGAIRGAHDSGLHVVDDRRAATDDGASELTTLVRSIRNAAALSDVRPPHRPWLPALPELLTPAELPLGAPCAGLVDVPVEQARRPLAWRPEDGNLAVVGAVGSGTTTALRSVVIAACSARPPNALHVYVVDARGDRRLDALVAMGHCGAVVRPHERERIGRLLRRLTDELDARRAAGGGGDRERVVLAVDGLPALRATLDDPLDRGDGDALHRILTEGPAVGIAAVITAERPAALPAAVLAGCGERWVLHLDDPADAPLAGVRAALVPGPMPGRLVVASTRCEAQVVDLGVHLAGLTGDPAGPAGPRPITVLGERVDCATLPASGRTPDGELSLVTGIAFDTLESARLAVPDGEHVLVVGPARSGRTTTLARLVAAWRGAHPTGLVQVVAGRDRAAPDVTGAVAAIDAAGAPALLVVDDAERVDDPDGALAALVAERRSGVLVIAAARPDGLRPQFGHWTTAVRRSRLGVLMAACTDVDGDLLGELLPRRRPLPSRPGLAWLVDAGGRRLVQIAMERASR